MLIPSVLHVRLDRSGCLRQHLKILSKLDIHLVSLSIKWSVGWGYPWHFRHGQNETFFLSFLMQFSSVFVLCWSVVTSLLGSGTLQRDSHQWIVVNWCFCGEIRVGNLLLCHLASLITAQLTWSKTCFVTHSTQPFSAEVPLPSGEGQVQFIQAQIPSKIFTWLMRSHILTSKWYKFFCCPFSWPPSWIIPTKVLASEFLRQEAQNIDAIKVFVTHYYIFCLQLKFYEKLHSYFLLHICEVVWN